MHKNLEARGRKELTHEGLPVDGLTLQTFLEVRYAGQSYELSVPVESLVPNDFVSRFHAAHHERYGHSDASRAVEIVTLRVKLVLPSPVMGSAKGELGKGKQRAASPALIKREIWFDGKPARTQVYERAELSPGATFRGPAIVVQMDSTTAVPPGWRAQVDAAGNLVLEVA